MFFVLREEFAFLFQTFSRSDPPGKAPLTRGRYVFKKEKKEKINFDNSFRVRFATRITRMVAQVTGPPKWNHHIQEETLVV